MRQGELQGAVAQSIEVQAPGLRLMVQVREPRVRVIQATAGLLAPGALPTTVGRQIPADLLALVGHLQVLQEAEALGHFGRVVQEVAQVGHPLEDLPAGLHRAGQVLDVETK